MFLSDARDDDDPACVRILTAGHRQADQRDDKGRVFACSWFFLLVLFFSFVTLVGEGMVSVLSWQFSNKPV
jgi:hypothetical protein